MNRAYLFYNPLARGGDILEDLDALEFVVGMPCVRCDMTQPQTYESVLFETGEEDVLILCGGDGTLNRFANLTQGLPRRCSIGYYPGGTNNDFALDHGRGYGSNPFGITGYLENLPQLALGERTGCFLTGIVYDGCAGKRRSLRQRLEEEPRTVTLTADGIRNFYDRVQFAAVLHGRHCAGGLIPDPGRKPGDGDLSCVLIHSCGRLWGNFLKSMLSKGRKLPSRCCSVIRGADFSLLFDAPVTLHTDGEVKKDVRRFQASVRPL